MNVDPVDGCTFWYTNEYVTGNGFWSTRIGSFSFDSCTGIVGQVVPDVKANDSNGPVTLAQGERLIVNVELDPGDHTGENADWWVNADSPLGTFWYTLNSGWQLSGTPIRAYGGPLFNLTPFTILDISNLAAGGYTVNFEVDDNMDGIKDGTYKDSVQVSVQ